MSTPLRENFSPSSCVLELRMVNLQVIVVNLKLCIYCFFLRHTCFILKFSGMYRVIVKNISPDRWFISGAESVFSMCEDRVPSLVSRCVYERVCVGVCVCVPVYVCMYVPVYMLCVCMCAHPCYVCAGIYACLCVHEQPVSTVQIMAHSHTGREHCFLFSLGTSDGTQGLSTERHPQSFLFCIYFEVGTR